MKFVRLAIWIAATLLALVHAGILLVHGILLFFYRAWPAAATCVYALLIFSVGIILFFAFPQASVRKKDPSAWVCSVLAVLLGAGLVWFVLDDAAIDPDYHEKDIAVHTNDSHSHLEVLNSVDTSVLEKASKKTGDGYRGNEGQKDFIDAWKGLYKQRKAIDALDKYEVVCDLPKSANYDINTPLLNFMALKTVTRIYCDYFLFNVSTGHAQEAIHDFCQLNRVARKAMADATLLIHKMMFANMAKAAIETAQSAIDSGRCEPATLLLLQTNFTPFTGAELSLKKPIIGEYLILKSTMKEQVTPETILNSVIMTDDGIEPEKKGDPVFSALVYHLGFKPNRSLAEIKTYYDMLIEAQKHLPADNSKAKHYLENYRKKPPIHNMIGWALNSMAMPDFETYSDRLEKMNRLNNDLYRLISEKYLKVKKSPA